MKWSFLLVVICSQQVRRALHPQTSRLYSEVFHRVSDICRVFTCVQAVHQGSVDLVQGIQQIFIAGEQLCCWQEDRIYPQSVRGKPRILNIGRCVIRNKIILREKLYSESGDLEASTEIGDMLARNSKVLSVSHCCDTFHL